MRPRYTPATDKATTIATKNTCRPGSSKRPTQRKAAVHKATEK